MLPEDREQADGLADLVARIDPIEVSLDDVPRHPFQRGGGGNILKWTPLRSRDGPRTVSSNRWSPGRRAGIGSRTSSSRRRAMSSRPATISTDDAGRAAGMAGNEADAGSWMITVAPAAL